MEIRFYEIIGIKKFKKILISIILLFFHDRNILKGSNYYIESLTISGLKSFSKKLMFNVFNHIIGFVVSVIFIITDKNYFNKVILFFIIVFNVYCVLLQRYNYLRMQKILKRYAIKN